MSSRNQSPSGHRQWVIAALSAAVAAAVALPAGAQLPVGPTIELNVSPPCAQDRPAAAILGSGEVVTAWVGPVAPDFEEQGVAARIVPWPGPAGQPLGDEIRLDPATAGSLPPEGVALAAAADGGFYAAWWGVQSLGADALRLRAFDAGGQPLGDAVDAGPGVRVTGAALATDAEGRPAIAWREESGAIRLRQFESDLTPRGEVIEVAPPSAEPPPFAEGPSLAIAEDGSTLLVWPERESDFDPPLAARIMARLVDPFGTPAGAAMSLDATGVYAAVATAALDGGRFVVLWSNSVRGVPDAGIYGRLLDASGSPTGAVFAGSSLALEAASKPAVVALAGGGFLAAWSATAAGEGPDQDADVFLRVFGPGAVPAGAETQAAPEMTHPPLQSHPTLTLGDAGRVFVAWRQHYPPPLILVPPCFQQARIVGQPLVLGCTPTESRLCLRRGRFGVEVTVDDPRLGPEFPRAAGADPLTSDTGTFWFFRPGNVELMVKVLDGRPVNGRHWFFSGALSNVGHEIVVTDHLSGEERRYENAPGELASRADTAAFEDPLPPPAPGGPAPAAATVAAAPIASAPPAAPRPAAGPPPPPCADVDLLCLHGERIRVRLEWSDPRTGSGGSAVAVPLSDVAGWFWFFRPDNAEVVVKVLDGFPTNEYWWVFYGGLTDLELTLTVEDAVTGIGRTYHKPPFTLVSFADTAALPGPFPCPICSAAAPAPSTRSAGGDGTP